MKQIFFHHFGNPIHSIRLLSIQKECNWTFEPQFSDRVVIALGRQFSQLQVYLEFQGIDYQFFGFIYDGFTLFVAENQVGLQVLSQFRLQLVFFIFTILFVIIRNIQNNKYIGPLAEIDMLLIVKRQGLFRGDLDPIYALGFQFLPLQLLLQVFIHVLSINATKCEGFWQVLFYF